MKIVFTMSVRDELPGLLNKLAQEYGQPAEYEETRPIDLMRQVDWPAVPRRGDSVWISEDAAARVVQGVHWDLEAGDVRVALDDLDTDELGDERSVVESLLDQGWQVDSQMMGWDRRG